MKVLFVISSLGAGGAERVLSTLTNHLAATPGMEVTIATYDPGTEDFYELHPEIKRVTIDFRVRRNLLGKLYQRISRLIALRKLVRESQADVVVSFIVYANLETILATRLMGSTKVVVSEHSNYWRVTSRWLRRARLLLYPLAHRVVLLTHRDKEIYDRHMPNCTVIPNPIALEASALPGEREKTVLCIGRLHEVKQFEHAIKAFEKVHRAHPDWNLHIAGTGERLASLQTLADQLNLSGAVIFRGAVKDVAALYEKSGIFVLCSQQEGFPMALGEAMLCGMPVISYDCPTGPGEMITDASCGLLVEHNNIDALSDGIMDFIEHPEKRSACGMNAAKQMERYSIENISQKWMELFEPRFTEQGKSCIC